MSFKPLHFLVALSLFGSAAQAQSFDQNNSIVVTVRDDNMTSATLPSSNTKYVIFEKTTSGNSTQPLIVEANAPQGAKAKVMVFKAKNNATSELQPRGAFYLDFINSKGRKTQTLGNGSASSTPNNSNNNSNGEDPRIAELQKRFFGLSLEEIQKLFGGKSIEEILDIVFPPGATPTYAPPGSGTTPGPSGSGIYGTTVISKDACDRSNPTYVVRLIVDLTALQLPAGTVINGKLNMSKADGASETLVKISDSNNHLIVLMRLNSYFNSRVNIVRWLKGGTPKTMKSFSVSKMYFHHRYGPMAKIDLAGLETGQKVTAERVDGGSTASYGVCIRLARVRQQLNGFQR